MQEMESHTQNEFDNSRPLDVHRWSEFPEVKAAVNHLADELRESTSKKLTAKQKRHLRVVVLDLYSAYLIDPTRYVAYSRNRNNYNPPSRYDKLFIRYDPLIQVIDSLSSLGYLEGKMGFRDIETGVSKQTRMRATMKLIDLIQNRHKVTPPMIQRAEGEEVIILRDHKKKKIDYEDTPETNRMRDNLKRYNEFLSKASISLAFRPEDMPRVDWTADRLHRVFNNGTFEEGGRFYGGWWQHGIPRELRGRILINGMPTVEIDYSGFHIRLLYTLKNLEFEGDPYQFLPDKSFRGLLKQCILVSINTKGRKRSLLAIRKSIKKEHPELIPDLEMVDKQPGKLGKLLDEFLDHHKPISEYIYSGMGIKLQELDSRIAEWVMMDMTAKGILVLPVHDSFICEYYYEKELNQSMRDAFKSLTDYQPGRLDKKDQLTDGFVNVFMNSEGKIKLIYSADGTDNDPSLPGRILN